MTVIKISFGPEHPYDWWEKNSPPGECQECGGQCDGGDCGIHAAGCVFGGFSQGYWMIAEGCPLFHGEKP